MVMWLASIEYSQQASSKHAQQGISVLHSIARKPFRDNQSNTDDTK